MSLHPDIERLALLGWRCVPVTQRRTGFWKGYIDAATHDLDQLDRWVTAHPGCNWSVIPEGSGVWALDVDVPSPDHEADGTTWMRSMTDRHGPLPEGPRGRSGGGGFLIVFRDTGAPIKRQSGFPAPGIDPRAARVQFTVAPSIHRRTQAPYRWIVAPWDLSPPVAPEWLLAAVAPPPAPPAPKRPFIPSTTSARRRLLRGMDAVTSAPAGTRNATLNREAFAVARWVAAGLLDEREAVAALYSAGISVGLTPVEVRATIRSGSVAGYRVPVEARPHA